MPFARDRRMPLFQATSCLLIAVSLKPSQPHTVNHFTKVPPCG